jgi:hypothetical protein
MKKIDAKTFFTNIQKKSLNLALVHYPMARIVYAREVTGLEVINSNPSTTEAVSLARRIWDKALMAYEKFAVNSISFERKWYDRILNI